MMRAHSWIEQHGDELFRRFKESKPKDSEYLKLHLLADPDYDKNPSNLVPNELYNLSQNKFCRALMNFVEVKAIHHR